MEQWKLLVSFSPSTAKRWAESSFVNEIDKFCEIPQPNIRNVKWAINIFLIYHTYPCVTFFVTNKNHFFCVPTAWIAVNYWGQTDLITIVTLTRIHCNSWDFLCNTVDTEIDLFISIHNPSLFWRDIVIELDTEVKLPCQHQCLDRILCRSWCNIWSKSRWHGNSVYIKFYIRFYPSVLSKTW